jgi:A/G-specific adenine glycosylase
MMELGATVCLPRGPLCMQCPVVDVCATRGEHGVVKRKKMRRRDVAYALARRKTGGGAAVLLERRGPDAEVLLERRALGASLMPGMWELPGIDREGAPEWKKALTVRHAITETNYRVTIYELSEKQLRGLRTGPVRRWFAAGELPSLPLTGLARKTLKRLGAWPDGGEPGGTAGRFTENSRKPAQSILK